MLQLLRVLLTIGLLGLATASCTTNQAPELAGQFTLDSQEQAQQRIDLYTKRIEKNPSDIDALVKLGNTYFAMHDFEHAVDYYGRAIKADDHADAAYFGRGLALGRSGLIKDGIKDLSVYIERHPTSSLAYTKRGVRHLWLGEEEEAKQDLTKALELNPKNAEASDDLGVIYLKKHQYIEAIRHFSDCVRLDPTYQKGYHNLAMAYYLIHKDYFALDAVGKALLLNSQDRSSVILKADILTAMGETQEAQELRDEAEFLPEGNWSETISVK